MDRPDILHFALLTVLGYARLIDNIDIYFTCSTGCFRVDATTRIPRSQERFYGILEQILSNTYNGTHFQQVYPSILRTAQSPIVYFTRMGKTGSIKDILNKFDTFVFGGFAHGSFRTSPTEQDILFSLSDQPLELWTALSLVLSQMC